MRPGESPPATKDVFLEPELGTKEAFLEPELGRLDDDKPSFKLKTAFLSIVNSQLLAESAVSTLLPRKLHSL